MKRIILLFLSGLGALIVVLIIKASSVVSKQSTATKIDAIDISDEAVNHLSEAVKIKTISFENSADFDPKPFQDLHDFIKKSFPLVDKNLTREVISNHSLLFTWKGSDVTKKPALMLAHMDVVPIEPGTEASWKYPAYSGQIAEGYIWGRGAIDDKVNVISILEAVEKLLLNNFQPTRTIYLAFGHDEELSGEEGAAKIAALLKSRNVELDFVLDEGLFILDDQLPGISKPVAFIGVAEKGYLDVELSVKSKGGHSSQPPKETSIAILSKALLAIQNNPFPRKIDGAIAAMLDYAAPEMDFVLKLVFANRWLFSPIIKSELAGSPTTNAVIRTTAAPTMLSGSQKANVLPANAKAVVNFRILPGESIASVLEYIKNIVADDRVDISALPGSNEPVAMSDLSTSSFKALQQAIVELFPGTVVVPSLMIGGTDSKRFAELTKNIYRFSPMHLSEEDLGGFHGSNERINVENYKKIINFYVRLVKLIN